MSKGIPAYFSHDKYNIKPIDVCRLYFNCEPQDIHSEVIITPDWSADFLANAADKIITVSEGHIYNISYRDKIFTLVRSGIGAPMAGDAVIALSCTPCRHIIFTGSFGGLSEKLAIGDLMITTESIGGDGYSSYLRKGKLSAHAFLKPAKPNAAFNALLEEYAAKITAKNEAALHQGKIFSSDTIVAQFQHLDMIIGQYGCMGIEMETAAVFNAAALVGIPAAALLIVSDVIHAKKSLFSGRTKADIEKYQQQKRTILSRIILDTLSDGRLTKI